MKYEWLVIRTLIRQQIISDRPPQIGCLFMLRRILPLKLSTLCFVGNLFMSSNPMPSAVAGRLPRRCQNNSRRPPTNFLISSTPSLPNAFNLFDAHHRNKSILHSLMRPFLISSELTSSNGRSAALSALSHESPEE